MGDERTEHWRSQAKQKKKEERKQRTKFRALPAMAPSRGPGLAWVKRTHPINGTRKLTGYVYGQNEVF